MLKLDEKYCQIINRFTGKIIVSGKIINHKELPIKCITFDNKHFFNLKWNLFYKIIICDYCAEIQFDNIKYKNKIKPWSSAKTDKLHFIFREKDITELDEEIKDLVYSINSAGFKTVGSCCGHGKYQAWIDISFISFQQLYIFIQILQDSKFISVFNLTTSPHILNNDDKIINLRLLSKNIGEDAYQDINKFAEYLKFFS